MKVSLTGTKDSSCSADTGQGVSNAVANSYIFKTPHTNPSLILKGLRFYQGYLYTNGKSIQCKSTVFRTSF